MNYHNILHEDMRNGSGLRVVLFCSFCEHKCYKCQNPQTWDKDSGIKFDDEAKSEIFDQLSKDYISGLTLSGGDPLGRHNLNDILSLVKDVKENFPMKDIWVYTGYTYEYLFNYKDDKNNAIRKDILNYCDVLVDSKFEFDLLDANYKWAGSTNQRIIDLKESFRLNKISLLQ